MGTNPMIRKASGIAVEFDPHKLRTSLFRTGANKSLVEEIVQIVITDLVEGQTTRAIYKRAFSLLRKKRHSYAARYKLKQAIMELGPSGFPFETYLGELFRLQGYKVETGVIYQGHAVTHEVDIVARKPGELLLMECKFKNRPGYTCDVKVPLYIHSRFNDVVKMLNIRDQKIAQCRILTNTRFTMDAVKYAKAYGLHLMSWDYPHEHSIRDWVDHTGLHPITSLTTLTKGQKNQLLKQGVVLCLDICHNGTHLQSLGLKAQKIKNIQAEAQGLCQHNTH